MEIIYDIETFPNCFTLAAEHADYPMRWAFEISDSRDDSQALIQWVHWIYSQHGTMVGFNNVGFDYPVIHTLLTTGKATARSLYDKVMAIIQGERFSHGVYPSDRVCPQLDLFLIHHFDNFARATSLKTLEFNMRMDNVSDLPFPVGTILNREQVALLKVYNAHDVTATKMFYHNSKEMIAFREELTVKYHQDFMNYNDTKIGKQFFIMELEKAGVKCYDYGTRGRQPKQTLRPVINLGDAILPWIKFNNPALQTVADTLRALSVTETKGTIKDLTATVQGFKFVFGLGGIHGSVTNRVVEETEDRVIVDLDVTSFYPSLAIVNGFYPEHLGPTFCTIYADLKMQRVTHKKGSAENAMLKLALNGVYGDSNNKFSVFYDPLFTMKITLNGQLLLARLAEWLMMIPTLELIQVNTDGMTITVDKKYLLRVENVKECWQKLTNLDLEEAHYSRMVIADVNNYLAVDVDGKIKRKGKYEYKMDWSQNHSALVVPKVAEKVLLEGEDPMRLLMYWPDRMDFMFRIKIPKGSRLENQRGDQFPNTTRYYVCDAEEGETLFKVMHPLKDRTEMRYFALHGGYRLCVCNDIAEAIYPIDYAFYMKEVEKLLIGR